MLQEDLVFYDKSIFYLYASHGCLHVQCKPREGHVPESIQYNLDPGVMVHVL